MSSGHQSGDDCVEAYDRRVDESFSRVATAMAELEAADGSVGVTVHVDDDVESTSVVYELNKQVSALRKTWRSKDRAQRTC